MSNRDAMVLQVFDHTGGGTKRECKNVLPCLEGGQGGQTFPPLPVINDESLIDPIAIYLCIEKGILVHFYMFSNGNFMNILCHTF